jgi:hypothetical protein
MRLSAGLARAVGVVAAFGFMALMVFQLLLVLGLPLGRMAWGGEFDTLPWVLRIGSLLSVAVLAVATVLVLEKTGMVHVVRLPRVVQAGLWALVVLFALSTVANVFSQSDIEKRIMTPVAALLTLCCLLVALAPASEANRGR